MMFYFPSLIDRQLISSEHYDKLLPFSELYGNIYDKQIKITDTLIKFWYLLDINVDLIQYATRRFWNNLHSGNAQSK
jgi:hypothetical protein